MRKASAPWYNARPLGLLLLVATLPACFLEFSADQHNRCYDDLDCLEGRICQIPQGQAESEEAQSEGGTPSGICVDIEEDEVPSDCSPFDLDQDQSFTLAACGPLDCDDSDARRSPRLPELCDGVDNNCDGQVDEGLRNVCGGCDTLPTEACNGLDDDCDGIIDDGVRNACGFCGPVPEEVCDREDNDCDGQVDEGLDCACAQDAAPRACPATTNASTQVCEPGQQRCLEGRWGPCEGAQLGQFAEICDGADNNCNGRVDETFSLANDKSHCGACNAVCHGPWAQSSCQQGQCQLICLAGHYDIDGDPSNGCEYTCLAGSDIERCDDGLDNNCDGRVDESCVRTVLGGRWAFFNLYGRNADQRPPALVTGVLEVQDPIAGTATISDLRRYTAQEGERELVYSAQSQRQITLSPEGDLVLAPAQENDPAGGTFRGTMSMTSGRELATLVEYNGEGAQIASFALLVRLPPEEISTTGHEAVRGPYAAVQMRPHQLLVEGDRSPLSVGLSAWSLDASAPQGRGLERQIQRGDGSVDLPAPGLPVSLRFQSSQGRFFLWREQQQDNISPLRLDTFRGAVTSAGGVGIFTRGEPEADSQEATPVPALVAMVERRATVTQEDLEGQWSLHGFQVLNSQEGDRLRYNAMQHELRLAPGAGQADVAASLLEEDGGLRPAGEISLVSLADRDGAGTLLAVELTVPDNLDGPTLRLRGHLTGQGQVAVLWEIDDEQSDIPTPSLFFLTRRPSAN